jgi:uncharacterized protein YfiM (DUF2279 family)
VVTSSKSLEVTPRCTALGCRKSTCLGGDLAAAVVCPAAAEGWGLADCARKVAGALTTIAITDANKSFFMAY